MNTIIESSPVDWDTVRRREYFEWAAKVVAGCRGANAQLEATFNEVYHQGRRLLG